MVGAGVVEGVETAGVGVGVACVVAGVVEGVLAAAAGFKIKLRTSLYKRTKQSVLVSFSLKCL